MSTETQSQIDAREAFEDQQNEDRYAEENGIYRDRGQSIRSHERYEDDPEPVKSSIDLGYMSIVDGEWSAGYCYCEDCDPGEKCDGCEKSLDPDEIVIPSQNIIIFYDYPFKDEFPHVHHTKNQVGFTRREISEQIMARYAEMYKEEDEDVGSATGYVPGMLNRQKSNGRYGIWGHNIGDLQLHTMQKVDNGYVLGIDS